MIILAITGSEDLLRIRALQKVIKEKKGWQVMTIDGSVPDSVLGALSQAGMFDQKVLAVVNNPNKVDTTLLETCLKTEEDSVVLLLYLEEDPKGNTKFGKFLPALGKSHQNFERPDKPWKQETAAEDFCVKEVVRLGFTIKPPLAKAVVSAVGTDLGVLSFEIFKMTVLAEVEGVKEITPQIAKGCLAGIMEGGVSLALDALSYRDPGKMGKALLRIEKSYKDPVMLVCRAVESRAYSWLPVVKAREAGLNLKDAAEQSGMNAWFYETKLYPQTVNWTTGDIIGLVGAMAESERALLNGAVAPWVFLKSKLLTACRRG